MARNPYRRYEVTEYQKEALKFLQPPEDITVSEWADKYRVLDAKTSAMPGPWRTEHTPYLKGIRAREAHPLAAVTDYGRMSRLWRSPFGSVIATTVRLVVCATWMCTTLPGLPTATSGPPSFFYHLSGSQRKQDTVIGGLGVCVSRIPPVEQNRILIA